MANEVKRSNPFPSIEAPASKRLCKQDSLIVHFPSDIFAIIFSFLNVRDHLSARLVCSKWKKGMDAIPLWRQFRDHFVTLSRLFPRLTHDERKAELEKNDFGKLLDRGQHLRRLFQGRPVLKLEQSGELCLEDNPKQRDITDSKILCWQAGALNWLDTHTHAFSPFPLDDFLSALPSEDWRQFLRDVIQKKQFHKILCADERYLIPILKTTNPVIFIIDCISKKYIFQEFKYFQQWPTFNCTIWNGSVFFALKSLTFRLTGTNFNVFLFSLIHINLASMQSATLCQSAVSLECKLEFHPEKDFLLVSLREESSHRVFTIINKENQTCCDPRMQEGIFLGSCHQSFWTFTVGSLFDDLYSEYLYRNGTWEKKDTSVAKLHSHDIRGPAELNLYSHALFYPHILLLWKQSDTDNSVKIQNLRSRDLLSFYLFPLSSQRGSFTLLGDFFLYFTKNKDNTELYGSQIGETPQSASNETCKELTGVGRPFCFTLNDKIYYTRVNNSGFWLYGIPIRHPSHPIPISEATTFFIAGDSLLVQGEENFSIYTFTNPKTEVVP